MTASWSVCHWVCVCLISTRICFTDSLEPIGKTVSYDCTKSNMRSNRSFICHAFSTSFWMYISMYQIPKAIQTNICFCFSLYSTKESIVVSAFQILCMLAPVTSVLCDPFCTTVLDAHQIPVLQILLPSHRVLLPCLGVPIISIWFFIALLSVLFFFSPLLQYCDCLLVLLFPQFSFFSSATLYKPEQSPSASVQVTSQTSGLCNKLYL